MLKQLKEEYEILLKREKDRKNIIINCLDRISSTPYAAEAERIYCNLIDKLILEYKVIARESYDAWEKLEDYKEKLQNEKL